MGAVCAKNKTVYSSVPLQIFMIHSIKQPLMESVNTLFNSDASKTQKIKAVRNLWKAYQAISKLPEPTIENTWHPNAHNVIHLRDWLSEHCYLKDPWDGFMRRIFNFTAIIIDHDPPWCWIIDSVREEAMKMDWKPRGYEQENIKGYPWWKEEDETK